MHRTTRRLALAAALALPGTTLAAAPATDQFPSRPIRFIVTFPPGALNDLIARTLQPRLSEIWGHQVVVDNRPGAGTLIGTEMAARAPADGHTLLLTAISHAINPSVYPKLPYDSVRDFAPVALIASSPYIMILHPSVNAKTVKEFVALAKAKPGQIAYGSTGTGGSSHLMGVMLDMMAGIQTVHVPYKGLAPALNDMIGGQIQFGFGSYSTVGQHIKTGRLRAIAVTSAKRAATTPDLPTIAESGFPGYDAVPWWGLMLPAGTPKPVVNRVNKDALQALQSKEVRERFEVQGIEPAGSTPEAFGKFLVVEIARWAKVVKQAGVKPE
ncbi:MAG: tripartite tricarboxylate transporter substrate binding protein [Burkholderiales bacterium]